MAHRRAAVISPLLANLYMNRFLKHWRRTGRGETYRAHVIVEEPALLVAVQRIVGGVEIEHDLPRRLAVRIEEHVDEHVLQRLAIAADLVDSGRRCRRGRAPAGSSCSAARTVLALGLEAVAEQRQHRIEA